MNDGYLPPEHVYSVIFDAHAEEAGERSWLVEADATEETLRIVDCAPVAERFGVSPHRTDAVAALASFLADLGGRNAVGLDFPFGLPKAVVPERRWRRFVDRLPDWFSGPEDMTKRCRMHARLVTDGAETDVLRATEEPLSAVAAYDKRLCAETFYGIRDVLRPLVLTDTARVVPMQLPSEDRPLVLETYPAGTLDTLRCQKRDGRPAGSGPTPALVLDSLTDRSVEFTPSAREQVLDGGDTALEAVVAAFATFRNTVDPANLRMTDELPSVEGYVYV
ncbi:hypothetical protein [Haloprofundus sp. MHR1]|uniref:hypothetical protein n=1 Tax=Haloprofundus sp. MHR1 TaxID=2572921 RepID=UPI0010BE483F|nr:hypothetical protein [Haloprofundus sp. MHR1]QCJ47552.1 hypothetical protein FCF25_10685 [Haloprofundus sp. MHR1]